VYMGFLSAANFIMKGNIKEFNSYLIEQIGQPYVWGGQHLKLTPENYVEVISRKETGDNRDAAIEYCRKKFDEGATVLYGYDCSGLGMYWLQNLKHIYNSDMNANSMMSRCVIEEEPHEGYWVFRLIGGRASHIGYMVSESEVIHAKGRKYGVVMEKYKPSYWHRVCKPSCMDFDMSKPTHKYVLVKRASVRIRSGNGTAYKTIAIVHKGDCLPLIEQEDKEPYWYKVKWRGQIGYITCNERYTELITGI